MSKETELQDTVSRALGSKTRFVFQCRIVAVDPNGKTAVRVEVPRGKIPELFAVAYEVSGKDGDKALDLVESELKKKLRQV